MKHITFALFAAVFLVILNIPNAGAQACGNFTSRLEIGMWARVTPGEPNNVRILPLHSSERIGQIPGGGEFVVLDGPECDNNYTWWKVDYNGLIGWTAEWGYIYGEYWLEPYESARPTSTIPPLATNTSVPTRAANTPVPTPTSAVEDQSADIVGVPSNARPIDSNVPSNILPATGYTGAGLTGQIFLLGNLNKDLFGITIDCRYNPERSAPSVRSGQFADYNADTYTATLSLGSYPWFEVLQGPSICFHDDVMLDSIEAVELSTGTSYSALSYTWTFNSGAKTRSVFLPVVAYVRGGHWQLKANGYSITVEISRQHEELIIIGKDEFTQNDQTVITDLDPYETVAIASVAHPKSGDYPGQFPPLRVRVLQYFQADSNGNAYLGDVDLYWFIHRFQEHQVDVTYLAIFGENGSVFTRFMSEVAAENIRRNIWGQ